MYNIDDYFYKALNDGNIAEIMSEMERKYQIPIIASMLPDWLANTQNADQILKVYRKIAKLRD